MNTKGQFSDAIFGASWRPRSLALVVAIIVVLSAVPALAQNTLPTTVREAAAGSGHASQPAHPATAQERAKQRALARMRRRAVLPQDTVVLYSNGPTNGTSNAYFMDVYVVSDSFVPNTSTNITSFDIGLWTPAGATPLTVDWSIGTTSFGSDIGSGSGAWTSLTLLCSNGGTINGGPCGGGFGYDVYDANFTVSNNPAVTGGNTYWVTLTGVTDSFSGRDAWDINSGPSQAFHNLLGAVPSESFTINGSSGGGGGGPNCFQSGGGIQILHDFTTQENPYYYSEPTGVTIDKNGVLYGTTTLGGNSADGLVFRLSDTTLGWNFNPLYNFTGNASGWHPSVPIVGPDGSLFGTAQGGIQNCGSDQSQWCGFVFNEKAYPTACLGCRTEKVIYAFSGDSGGAFPIVGAFDQRGNLYGVTQGGGNAGFGTVFKLTPTGTAGWTKTTLYSFTGGSDGSAPSQVLVGNDGNLYGIAQSNGGEIFQLSPSGSGWTLNVLHTFQGENWSYPAYLVQDSSGNLYGIASPEYFGVGAMLFVLSKSGGSWVINEFAYQHPGGNYDEFANLTIDAEGYLYGTGQWGQGCDAGLCRAGRNGQQPFFVDYIFQASYGNGGWYYNDIADFWYTAFDAWGALALDGSGNLYGTTTDCGKYGAGTVWQLAY